jgi:hypothetical protein
VNAIVLSIDGYAWMVFYMYIPGNGKNKYRINKILYIPALFAARIVEEKK